MSYCVHCGVELDESLKRCPLCNTPVIDPNEYELKEFIPKSAAPFPSEREEAEEVKKTDIAILLSVILSATALTCFILNLLIYKESWWSFYIIGICAVLWVYIFPPIQSKKLSIFTFLLMDYISTALYILLLALRSENYGWYFPVAFPIMTVFFILLCLVVFLLKRSRISFLRTALLILLIIGIECTTIELSLNLYFHENIMLTWAAVVDAVVLIIIVALTTILLKPNFRRSIQRRFHF